MELLEPEQIVQIMTKFKAQNPSPVCELEYKNPFTLLVSVVLSAQATDKSVNFYTKPLYEIADNPQAVLDLGQEKLVEFIKPIGLWKNKSKNIMALCRKLLDDFDGIVPHDRKKLMSLPGVGRKTANVVLNVIWGEPVMPVDTHIFRVARRTGLADGKTPEAVEEALMKRIPAEFLQHAHHWILLHGRYVCTARNPDCQNCLIRDLCCHNTLLITEN